MSMRWLAYAALVLGVVGCGRSSNRASTAQRHYQQGIELLHQGLNSGALAEFRLARSQGYRSADLHYHLACLTMAESDTPEQAEPMIREELDAALSLNPDHVSTLLFCAELARAPSKGLKGTEEALRLYNRVLELRPEWKELRLSIVDWLLQRPTMISPPGVRRAHDARRLPLDSNVSLGLAQQQLEKILEATSPLPGDQQWIGQARLKLGVVWLRMGEYRRAIDQLDMANSIFSETADGLGYRGLCAWPAGVALYKGGRHEAAVQALTSAALYTREPTRLHVLWNLKLAADGLGGYPDYVPEQFRLPLRPESEQPPTSPEGLPFRDVAPQLGVAKVGGAGPSAWSDIDGDGRMELFVSGCNTFSALYRYDGQRFQNITEQARLADLDWGFSANFVDYNNDGHQDLYITRNGWAGAGANTLYKNDGHGRFDDVTEQAGVACAEGSSFVSLWADFDRDGWLDLFVCNGVTGDRSRNVLYHNEHDGTFSDWTDRAGLAEPPWPGGTIGAGIGDYDDDGYPDLFVVGRSGVPNRLYHNRGNGTFEEVAVQASVAETPGNGYLAFLADFDGDEKLDIVVVPQAPWDAAIRGLTADPLSDEDRRLGNRLYLNEGGGHFRDVSLGSGLDVPIGSMGANIGDLDNDGYLDILFGAGDPNPVRLEPLRCFRNLGGSHFSEVTQTWGLWRLGKGHGITLADYDDDGRLDVYVPFGGWYHADVTPNALFRNQLPRQNRAMFVLLVGTDSNKNAIGARLRLTVAERKLVREVTGPNGFGSTNSYWTHFGLGTAGGAEELEIQWPSGRRQRFTQLRADCKYIITEGKDEWRELPCAGSPTALATGR